MRAFLRIGVIGLLWLGLGVVRGFGYSDSTKVVVPAKIFRRRFVLNFTAHFQDSSTARIL